MTYLDASALVKLFVPEVESDALNASLLGATDIVVSDLAVTESASALGRRVREGHLTRRAARDLHRRIIAFADPRLRDASLTQGLEVHTPTVRAR